MLELRPCLAWLQLWVELLHSRTPGGANFELSWNCLMEQLWVELELQKRCSKTPPSFALQLHGVLELGCLAEKLAGVAEVQLQSHAKQALYLCTAFGGAF